MWGEGALDIEARSSAGRRPRGPLAGVPTSPYADALAQHTKRSLAVAAAVPAIVFAVLAAAWGILRSARSHDVEATALPTQAGGFELVVHAAGGSLRPNVVYSAAGRPLRLVIRAGEGAPRRIAVPDLGLALDLAPGENVLVVETTPRGGHPITDGEGNAKGSLYFQ
jgi:hypothetical protein